MKTARALLLALALCGLMPPVAVAADLIGNEFGVFQPTVRVSSPVWPGRDRLHVTVSHGGFSGGFSKGVATGTTVNYGGRVLTASGADTLTTDVEATRTAITFFDPQNRAATWKRDAWRISSLFGFSWVDMQSKATLPSSTPNTTRKDFAQAGLHLGVGWSWLPEDKQWGARGRFLLHANPVSVVDAFSKDPNLEEEYFLAELEGLGVLHTRWGAEVYAGLAAWRYVWTDTVDNSVAKLDMRFFGPMAGLAWHF